MALRPDPDHPRSRGYACVKGTGYGAVHHHPDRALTPKMRDGAGAFRDVSWDEALQGVGGRLQAILTAHGADAVGLYLGNAVVHSLGTILGGSALQHALKTRKVYSALTLDNAPMFVVTEACLGNPMLTFVADYERSDLLVLIGTDPLVSQPSQAQSHPTGVKEIAARARAGQLVVVDPRPSATAKKASQHLRPRPGTDAALLAFLVREVLHRRPPDDPLLDPADVAALGAALARWDLGTAAVATGLSAEALGDLADRLLGAERPLVWSGLGVLLGPDGTVGYWLTLALQAVLGGLDREGGWLHHRGAVDLPGLTKHLGVPGSDPDNRSRIGDFPAVLGTLAAATMADDILTDGPDRLRALVVIGGNPARSLPDTPKAKRALEALDLLVCVDLFVNETGALADVVLPATTWLERQDVDLHMAPQRRTRHLQYTPAVVAPRGEAREDFDICSDLSRAVGRSPFGSWPTARGLQLLGGPTGLAKWAVRLLAPFSWRALRKAERGLGVEGGIAGARRGLGTDLEGGRLKLAVPEFVAALHAGVGPATRPSDEPGWLQLVTSVRPIASMNTWIEPALTDAVARLHPDDAAALGLQADAEVRLSRRDGGALTIPWTTDSEQAPGTVVVPWSNTLVTGDRLERFTGQPRSNSEWVRAAAAVRPG